MVNFFTPLWLLGLLLAPAFLWLKYHRQQQGLSLRIYNRNAFIPETVSVAGSSLHGRLRWLQWQGRIGGSKTDPILSWSGRG